MANCLKALTLKDCTFFLKDYSTETAKLLRSFQYSSHGGQETSIFRSFCCFCSFSYFEEIVTDFDKDKFTEEPLIYKQNFKRFVFRRFSYLKRNEKKLLRNLMSTFEY